MNRRDRLIGIALALLNRHETAQSLAAKFEVSTRTIKRDMQTLAELGVPVYAETGPAGGYRIMDGYKLPPLQLEPREALTLLFSLKAMQAYADTPFNRERWTVMDKIVGILPADTLAQVTPLLSRFGIDVPPRSYTAPLLEQLMAHTAAAHNVTALYRSQSGRKPVVLQPKRIYAANGFWYCEAYSYTHGEERLFRVDRFETVERSDPSGEASPVVAPRQARAPAKAETAAAVPVRVRLTYRGMILTEQDAHIGELIRQTGDDEWEVAFDCPQAEWEWAVRFFFAMGPEAEVLEPVRLREELRRIAEEQCKRYAD